MFCSGKETWSAFLELIADGPPIRRGQVKDLKRLKWNFIFRPSGLLLLRFRHVLVSWGIFRRGNRLNDGQITRNQTDVKCVNTSFYFRLHISRGMRVKIFTQPLKLTRKPWTSALRIFGAAMLNETIKQTCHDIDTEFGLHVVCWLARSARQSEHARFSIKFGTVIQSMDFCRCCARKYLNFWYTRATINNMEDM